MPQGIGFTRPLLRVWGWALPVAVYSSVALLKPYPPFNQVPQIPLALDAVLSLAMAVLITFRVNRAYERWWEARTLWGTLVNVSRNLAVKIRELVQPNDADRQLARDLIVAFSIGLKDSLRDEADPKKLPGFSEERRIPKHLPSYIARRLYELLERWRREGRISDQQFWVVDVEARVLLDVCGGCERIENTRISISWRRFARQCIVAYVLVLPWSLVDGFGIWVIPVSVVVAYFAIGGETIAETVETPFGPHEDHLDLDGICTAIDHSVSEVLGDWQEEDSA